MCFLKMNGGEEGISGLWRLNSTTATNNLIPAQICTLRKQQLCVNLKRRQKTNEDMRSRLYWHVQKFILWTNFNQFLIKLMMLKLCKTLEIDVCQAFLISKNNYIVRLLLKLTFHSLS